MNNLTEWNFLCIILSQVDILCHNLAEGLYQTVSTESLQLYYILLVYGVVILTMSSFHLQ